MPRVAKAKPKTVRKPTVKEPITVAIERKEDSMSKVTADTPKWGSLTVEGHNLSFVGEELVSLNIPYDDQNPMNHYIVCINGNQIILGVDEDLKVPKSVHDLFTQSVRDTNSAKKRMKQTTEIKV
jgi:hypothetical protein